MNLKDVYLKKAYLDIQKNKKKYKDLSNDIVSNGNDYLGFRMLRYCNNQMDYTMPFALWVPKADKCEKLSMFIYLHGHYQGGESGRKPISPISLRMAAAAKKHNSIIVIPSIPKCCDFYTVPDDRYPMQGKTGFDGIFSGLFELLKTRYPIDENRVYLAGSSNGASGVYSQIQYHPDRYAAAVAMMGSAVVDNNFFDILKNTPIWLVHSQNDKNVPIREGFMSGSDIIFDGLKKVGNPNIKYTKYKFCGHNASYVFTKTEKNWSDWLFKFHNHN